MDQMPVPLWGRFEAELEHPDAPEDPFRDVELKGKFVDPNGGEREFWGYYDGGAMWRQRFMPDMPGIWRYEIGFSDGAARMEGEFEAVASEIPGVLDRDGGNRIWLGHRGGRRLWVRGFHVGDRFFAENWAAEKRMAFLDWAQGQGYNLLSIASHYLNRPEEDRGMGWDGIRRNCGR